MINLIVAHERIHYAEGDSETIDHHHAVFKEFRSEVKGLELWRKNRYEFGQILHGLYTVYARTGPVECADIHPKAYETLLCWSLYQLRKEQDSDADLYKFIDEFVRYRDCYQFAAREAFFLGDFTERYQVSWRGRLGFAFDSVRFQSRVLNVSMATASVSVGLGCLRLFSSKRFAVAGLIGTYLLAWHSRRFTTHLEHRVGNILGKVFNSRLVWNKDAFDKALKRDAEVVVGIVDSIKNGQSHQE